MGYSRERSEESEKFSTLADLAWVIPERDLKSALYLGVAWVILERLKRLKSSVP